MPPIELSFLQDELHKLERMGAKEAEIFAQEERTLEIDVRGGRVENLQRKSDSGMGIRVIHQQQLGYSFTSDLSPEALEDARSAAWESAKHSDKDIHLRLPKPTRQQRTLNYYDPLIPQTDIQAKIEFVRSMENAALSVSPQVRRTDIARYVESEMNISVVNSTGVAGSYLKNFCGGFIDTIAEKDGEAESGFSMAFSNRLENFHPESIGREAGEEAAAFLGASPIPTGKYRVLLHPNAAVAFLDFLVHALSAESIQKGKSPFKGKRGQRVGSPALTLIDNATLPDGIGSQPFDGEGVPSSPLIIIQAGALQNYLYNTRTAAQDKRESTGHAVRQSYKTPPTIGPTNIYIVPGNAPQETMIHDTTRGVLLKRVIGAHTINPISGDFSVGAAGYLIENGVITRPTSRITFSGNLFDYLQRIEHVGNDLRFYPSNGNLGSPTLAIADGLISGI